MAISFE